MGKLIFPVKASFIGSPRNFKILSGMHGGRVNYTQIPRSPDEMARAIEPNPTDQRLNALHRADIIVLDCYVGQTSTRCDALDLMEAFGREYKHFILEGFPFLYLTHFGQSPESLTRYLMFQNALQMMKFPFGTHEFTSIFELVDLAALSGAEDKGAEIIYRAIDAAMEERKRFLLKPYDDMTGLYRENMFLSLAEERIRIARRNRARIAFVYGDMRNFKEVNDYYGHAVGDRVIAEVGSMFTDKADNPFRQSDLFARPHGDEFFMLFQELEQDKERLNIDRIVAKIRAKFEARRTVFNSLAPDVDISMSLGIFLLDFGQDSEAKELEGKADKYFDEEETPQYERNPAKYCLYVADMLAYLAKWESGVKIGRINETDSIKMWFSAAAVGGRKR